jgi:DNA-cytosine methyltransferase
MNVLNLFDGISCGQLALNRANISYDNYFASEIDKYAIQITQKNFPNTQQIGDVTKITTDSLPKIDLLMGGSPCQGFSFAGKQLNFEDERSKLFFEFVRLKNELKPKYFLLENVKMKKLYQNVISEHLGVEPIQINSALVSAQNRVRLYWTNIPNITQPEDKHILLPDILETGVVDRDKSYCIDANYWKGTTLEQYINKARRQIVFTERRTEEAKLIRKEFREKYGKDFSPRRAKELTPRNDDKSNCLTTSLTKEHILLDESYNFRKLTPLECERLQTVPDNYTEGISNTQRYKTLGNGWTVDVITHILKEMVF